MIPGLSRQARRSRLSEQRPQRGHLSAWRPQQMGARESISGARLQKQLKGSRLPLLHGRLNM